MNIKEFLDKPDVKDLIKDNNLSAVYDFLPEKFRGDLSNYLLDLGISAEIILSYFSGEFPEAIFMHCDKLTIVTIPDNVTTISQSAFGGCLNLTTVNLGNTVTTINGAAFNGCRSLTSIDIPSSVTIIDSIAFGSCSSLASITLPDSLTNIHPYAFLDCPNLKDIYYMGSEEQWEQIQIGAHNNALWRTRIHFAK